jgi:mannose-1-phosphate guanylyltransferase/mannose-1-phosphate guanylyltransferase/mannose-6-phosphate isomerase
MVDNVVILAGGSGTRLWPASTSRTPKQFLELSGGMSLLELTIRRAAALGIRGRILIVTHERQAEGARSICEKMMQAADEELPPLLVLPEPKARNTAPAVALAASFLARSDGDEAGASTMLVLPADHIIKPVEKFRKAVERADRLARKGFLLTFGIVPQRPETGYGYIEAGEAEGPGRLVRAFREKPDIALAREYLRSGSHFWNSGMFVFTGAVFFEELSRYAPDIAGPFTKGLHAAEGTAVRPAAATPEAGREGPAETADLAGAPVFAGGAADLSFYSDLPKRSLDYAVMEQSGRTAMIEADFRWSDVGSWDEIAAMDEGTAPAVFSVESDDNFVSSDLPVALCGVEGLHVIVKNGAVLVCKKGASQLVRDAVEEIRKTGMDGLV